jgi:hypothetical protein
LWSARYDRKVSDVFALQAEIARAITEAIGGDLGIARRRRGGALMSRATSVRTSW